MLYTIVKWVTAVHIALLLILAFEWGWSSSSTPPLRKAVAVHTVRLQPQRKSPPKAVAAAAKPSVKKNKTAAPTPKPTPTTKPKPNQPLLEKAQKALAQIDLSTPTEETSSSPIVDTAGYADEVATHLRAFLRLPEEGDVTAKLKLSRGGRLDQVKIVSSQSEKNRKYIENQISTLSFPPFERYYPNEKTFTLTLTLSASS